jgi:hypothetical protein
MQAVGLSTGAAGTGPAGGKRAEPTAHVVLAPFGGSPALELGTESVGLLKLSNTGKAPMSVSVRVVRGSVELLVGEAASAAALAELTVAGGADETVRVGWIGDTSAAGEGSVLVSFPRGGRVPVRVVHAPPAAAILGSKSANIEVPSATKRAGGGGSIPASVVSRMEERQKKLRQSKEESTIPAAVVSRMEERQKKLRQSKEESTVSAPHVKPVKPRKSLGRNRIAAVMRTDGKPPAPSGGNTAVAHARSLEAQVVGLTCMLNHILSDQGQEAASSAVVGGKVDVAAIMQQSSSALRKAAKTAAAANKRSSSAGSARSEADAPLGCMRGRVRAVAAPQDGSAKPARAGRGKVSTYVEGRKPVSWREEAVATETALFDGVLALSKAPAEELDAEESLLEDLIGGSEPLSHLPAKQAEEASPLQARANAVRQRAYTVWRAEEMVAVRSAIEGEVSCGGMAAREERALHADLSLQTTVADTLLQYHPAWLRVALETMTGMEVPFNRRSLVDGGVAALRRFLLSHVLGPDPNIAARYTGTVKGVFDSEHARTQAAAAVARVYSLVHFLDVAHQNDLMEGVSSTRLFRVDSTCKSTRDVVVELSKDLLAKESNPLAHVAKLGISMTVTQLPVDEVSMDVHSLASDMSDGVRFARLLEVLGRHRPHTLSRSLVRWPPGTVQNKTRSLRAVLSHMEESGVEVDSVLSAIKASGVKLPPSRRVDEPSIDKLAGMLVRAEPAATVATLWAVLGRFALPSLVPEEAVVSELVSLASEHSSVRSMLRAEAQRLSGGESDGAESDARTLLAAGTDGPSQRVVVWVAAAAVASGGSTVPTGATVLPDSLEQWALDLSDGAALCELVRYYRPWLVPAGPSFPTTASLRSRSDACRSGWALVRPGRLGAPRPDEYAGKNATWSDAIANERDNILRACAATVELGGVPLILPAAHSDKPLEPRVLSLFLAHLFRRIVSAGVDRSQQRAAIKINRWLALRIVLPLRLRIMSHAAALRARSLQRNAAGVVVAIQRIWRDRRQHVAASLIRRWWTATVSRYIASERALVVAILRQGLRGFARQARIARNESLGETASLLQAWARVALHRKRVRKVRCDAARVLQASIRGYLARERLAWELAEQRSQHGAAVRIQRFARCAMARLALFRSIVRRSEARIATEEDRAARVIQGAYSTMCIRQSFLELREDVTRLQAAVRGAQSRALMKRMVRGTVRLQRWWRNRPKPADPSFEDDSLPSAVPSFEDDSLPSTNLFGSAVDQHPSHPVKALLHRLSTATSPTVLLEAASELKLSLMGDVDTVEAAVSLGALPLLMATVRGCSRRESHIAVAAICLEVAVLIAGCRTSAVLAAVARSKELLEVVTSSLEMFRDKRPVAKGAIRLLAVMASAASLKALLLKRHDLLTRLSNACSAARRRARVARGDDTEDMRATAREFANVLTKLQREDE